MQKRFLAIWFHHLKTDRLVRKESNLKVVPFVLAISDHGRMRITEVSATAKTHGIMKGMVVGDAKVILTYIEVIDDKPELSEKLLTNLALWCIRYTPFAAVDLPDGLLLDTTGCTHLWGGEKAYIKSIAGKLKDFGYHIRAAMADTAATAWAVSRYGRIQAIIPPGKSAEAILPLPPVALRLNEVTQNRLYKLGLHKIGNFMNMQRSVLRRRFGEQLLTRLDYALGIQEEGLKYVQPIEPYLERLPCVEPISTRIGIEIALERLLNMICKRLVEESKGVRVAVLKSYRIDNKVEEIQIATNHPSNHFTHLFKLFELKIGCIEPALGIELFTLEATKVEDVSSIQETFWTINSNLESKEIAELLDGLQGRFGNDIVHRYLPDEHYLPERSLRLSSSLCEQPATAWQHDRLRPIQLLQKPEPIQVTAPIPDYPPMNFRYNGKLHFVKKADACERIESEWWLDGGLHRDYYIVEDEDGKRYWLFRLGHYDAETVPLWFIHGFFE